MEGGALPLAAMAALADAAQAAQVTHETADWPSVGVGATVASDENGYRRVQVTVVNLGTHTAIRFAVTPASARMLAAKLCEVADAATKPNGK